MLTFDWFLIFLIIEVLGVAKDAPKPTVKRAFREFVKDAHGDQGGNDTYGVSELKRSRDVLLDDA